MKICSIGPEKNFVINVVNPKKGDDPFAQIPAQTVESPAFTEAPTQSQVDTTEMTKQGENISIAEPNLDQIKTYWETNDKLESIFALRRSGKAINNYDFEFIIQPRLATFTSLQGNLETDPKEQLRDLIRKSYFVEAFNLAGSIINHQIKDPGEYFDIAIISKNFSTG